ncbi:hypothetical protein GRJ2_001809600 [Grus japonensis]|uniref:Uncharacterized protein n=1 Tax=Grus japonensis TaxID=30415 RepID=A0ABC9X6W8_GRUJA
MGRPPPPRQRGTSTLGAFGDEPLRAAALPATRQSPVRPRHASAGADVRRQWARVQGGSHLRWQQKPSSASDRSTAKEKLCKLFSMTL